MLGRSMRNQDFSTNQMEARVMATYHRGQRTQAGCHNIIHKTLTRIRRMVKVMAKNNLWHSYWTNHNIATATPRPSNVQLNMRDRVHQIVHIIIMTQQVLRMWTPKYLMINGETKIWIWVKGVTLFQTNSIWNRNVQDMELTITMVTRRRITNHVALLRRRKSTIVE